MLTCQPRASEPGAGSGGRGQADPAPVHGRVPAADPRGGRCTRPGEVGRLLRREGLYTSHLSGWRKARRNGSLQGLTPKKRGAKPAEPNPLSAKVRALEAKVAWLEKELATAHTILDVQGKVAGLLGFSLSDGKNC